MTSTVIVDRVLRGRELAMEQLIQMMRYSTEE